MVKEKTEQKRSRLDKKRGKALPAVLISLAVLIVLAAGAAVYAVYGYNRIYSGVVCRGVDFSGMTKKQAEDALEEIFLDAAYPRDTLKVHMGASVVSFGRDNTGAGVAFDTTALDAAEEIYKIGRDGSFFKRLVFILAGGKREFSVNSDGSFYINKELILDTVSNVSEREKVEPRPMTYRIEGGHVVFTRPESGQRIDPAHVAELVARRMEERDFRTMQFSAAEIAPESPDIGKIYKEVYRAPADATVKTAPGEGITVLPHVTGVDFDTDAVTQWLEEGDTPELSLPLTYTQPKITQEALSIALFRDELSSFKTSFSGSSQNRSNNIALCSGAVNETVLLPGQSFSFNATVGERTPERGYLEAGAYVGGKLVESVGGGICQVSSTLYNAVLLADLKITDRSNHSMTVGYVRTGLDATVNWGTIDFAFENTREYPIKIRMWTEGTTLFAVIVGTKTNDYTVTIRREILSQTPRETVVTVNPNLAPGTTVTVEAGHDGSSVQTYRVVTDGAGNVISSTPEAKSTYRRVNKQIESGPDPVSAANPSPPPVPPEPATPPAQSGEGGGTDIPSEDPPGQETPNVQI